MQVLSIVLKNTNTKEKGLNLIQIGNINRPGGSSRNQVDNVLKTQNRGEAIYYNGPCFQITLTLFTIAYFTDDSPSHGVVITPPQAKRHSKFFSHQNLSLHGVRVSIFGFEGPEFESQQSPHFH